MNVAGEKMESLIKYVPFIDFVLKIDPQKYIKFSNIKKWILLKKKNYPLSNLNKIEQSIITQYKNLLLEKKVQIPQNITDIFASLVFNEFVNLCSDDEEEIQNEQISANNSWKVNIIPKKIDGREDDDLEFIGVDNVGKMERKTDKGALRKPCSTSRVVAKVEAEIDEVSQDILNKIDKLTADDIKMKSIVHEPNNYTYSKENDSVDSTDGEGVIYQRRPTDPDVLFKRRADFEDEVIVENLVQENEFLLSTNKPIEIISLDSDSESELCTKNDRPSTNSKRVTSNKTSAAEGNVVITFQENEKIVKSSDSNSNGSGIANKKLDLLCNSRESGLPDMYDSLNESEDVNNTKNVCDTQPLEGRNDEEIKIITCEKSINNKNTPDLTPEQISKLLETISSKTELDFETRYEPWEHVHQTNSAQNAQSETPPPAPPLIVNNFPTPPLQYCSISQQKQFNTPTPFNYSQNSNCDPISGGIRPPQPKINFNDPRIKKHLQILQKSPLYDAINAEMGQNIRNICPAQPHLQQHQRSFPNNNMMPSSRRSTHSSISYGEYKRRELEKKLEMERQKEEERKAKAVAQIEREQNKLKLSQYNEETIRSKILSTLSPCTEQLTSVWSQQKYTISNLDGSNSNRNMALEQQIDANIQMVTISDEEINAVESNTGKTEQEKNSKGAKQSNNKNENNSSQNKNIDSEKKLNRVRNVLNCTFKGYDHIQHYIVEESLNKSAENEQISDTTEVRRVTPKPVGLQRRSSIHALSSIKEQLEQQSSDGSDSEHERIKYNSKRHLPSSSSVSQCTAKKRKTIDEIRRTCVRAQALRIRDDDDDTSMEDEANRNKITTKDVIIKNSYVKLYRMSDNFIRKHTKRLKEDFVNKHDNRLKKTCEKVKTLKEPVQKMPKLKKYNNDCQMTERNTVFCVLCRSKPSDLTNHYIGRHKTESYVARLDFSELEDLTTNPPFAKLQPKSKNSRFERYEVECPFCKETLCDQFINLYNHYAAHTGEYAFQCSHCHLTKPYRPDIQSHILHSKACRNSSIQVLYRYPPQALCIYLHCCTICNFVQLNEANVLKHLREHHDCSKAVPSNVQKCILTAMSDGPESNQTHKSPSPIPTPTPPPQQVPQTLQQQESIAEVNHLDTNILANQIKFKVDDDDIPVSNEPCLEDEYVDDVNYSLEEQLKKLHEGPTLANAPPMAMTMIHCVVNSGPTLPPVNVPIIPNLNSKEELRHLPMKIKIEDNANQKPQDIQAALKIDTVYEKYRSYPLNVSYLGLYKCMIGDCYYSTDCSEEILKHLNEHYTNELKPNEDLQCPYCVISLEIPIAPVQLVDHIRTRHGHLNFQCSMCCYRSCNAYNVHIHQKMHHGTDLNICKIYKCPNGIPENRNTANDLETQIAKTVFKISCRICSAEFFHTQFLVNHLRVMHNVPNPCLKIYSCIYCPFVVDNDSQIRIHIATRHPGEPPLVYDHNKQINYNSEDIKCSGNVVDISETVAFVEFAVNPTGGSKEDIHQDLKPDFQELLRMNEEIAKVRLQKLTTHTGISPDCLYRCPVSICGGFFSNFVLWLRHVKVRHCIFECACPHCPTATLLPLEDFALHFEQHRRHTFICFYCSTTSPTEQLARQHAVQMHSDFEPIRFEKIHFNINYSYHIMIQKDLFKEREKFIAEFLSLLENRLKELEVNETKKLKQEWPVQANNIWIDDYMQYFSKRKVALRCLMIDCNYRALGEKNLHRHLKTSHTISDTKFNCSKCDYQVQKCYSLDELFHHIKMHNDYIFICAACSINTPSRSKMSSHIRQQHSARDVPVIHLFRTSLQMYIKIYIVFSDNYITFSTMKNCFCCSERNMGGDVLSLHLKHYHKLTLKYYCENCNNFSFKSLKEVKPHFEQFHNSNKIKISCELTSHNDLNIVSLNEFQIQILTTDSVSQYIKSEPVDDSDNDVVLMEDNDVEIKNSLEEVQFKKSQERPQLKCASLSKLLDPTSRTLSSRDNWINTTEQLDLNSLKYCQSSNSTTVTTTNNFTMPSTSIQSPFMQPHFSQNNSNLQEFSTTSSLPSANVIAPTPYTHYNFDVNTINSSVSSNNSHIFYNNRNMTSSEPNNNIQPTPTQIGMLPTHMQNQVGVNPFIHVPSSGFHMGQNSHMQNSLDHPMSIPPQNRRNNC